MLRYRDELYVKHVAFGGGMKSVNAYTYYVLGEYVHDLRIVQPGIRAEVDVISVLVRGRDALTEFATHENPNQFPSSIEAAKSLADIVKHILTHIGKHSQRAPLLRAIPVIFTDQLSVEVLRAVSHFESLLSKELSELPLFCVEECGNLSIPKLLTGASNGYPKSTREQLSEFQRDEIDSAGDCLAFGQPTASGFHILRAVESLVRYFATKATGAEPKKRDWGHYCDLLEQNRADGKVVGIMRQINNLYRKPLMHPQDRLSPDDAIGLFCICQSAIESLVSDMKNKGFLPPLSPVTAPSQNARINSRR